jgi:hypothetical protein
MKSFLVCSKKYDLEFNITHVWFKKVSMDNIFDTTWSAFETAVPYVPLEEQTDDQVFGSLLTMMDTTGADDQPINIVPAESPPLSESQEQKDPLQPDPLQGSPIRVDSPSDPLQEGHLKPSQAQAQAQAQEGYLDLPQKSSIEGDPPQQSSSSDYPIAKVLLFFVNNV